MARTGILYRLAVSVLTAVLGSIAIFFLLEAVPGNVVQQMMGQTTDPQAAASMRAFFGLNRPLYIQYFDWIGGTLHGSFGNSWLTGQSVGSLVGSALLVTLELTFLTLIVSAVIGIPIGLITGMRRGRPSEKAGGALSILGLSTPIFWLGLLLLIGAAKYLDWAPPLSYANPVQNLGQNLLKMALPTLSLSFLQIGAYSQFVRDLVIAQLGEQYVATARAKGLHAARVTLRHVFPNILVPTSTFIGLLIVQILGGAVVIESIFGLPGLGRLLLNSINGRDYPVVRTALLAVVLLAITVNFLIDLLYRVIDPRLRQERQ